MERIVLGIDPGTASMGYGVIEQSGNRHKTLAYGCIRTSPQTKMDQRLAYLFKEIKKVIKKHQPQEVAVEELFFARNVKTAMSVAQARGIVLLSAAQSNLAVWEYKPNQVKSAVCGYGQADKKQVQIMVKKLLNMAEIVKPDDAADALAVAICHLQNGAVILEKNPAANKMRMVGR